jgi:hypothetical protein
MLAHLPVTPIPAIPVALCFSLHGAIVLPCNAATLHEGKKMSDLKAKCHHLFKEWKAVNRTQAVLGDIRTLATEKFDELRKSGLESDLADRMERELGELLTRQRRTLEDRRNRLEDELAEGGCPRGS